MATKDNGEKPNNNTIEVKWLSEPLDVQVHRNGTKMPIRKVKVRGLVGNEWIEGKAGVEPGTIRKIMEVVKLLTQHGYEARFDDMLRFVALYSKKDGLFIDPQLTKEYKAELVKGVEYRLTCDGKELDDIEEVRREKKSDEKKSDDDEPDGTTPDIMITCEKCGHRQRVGKRR